MNQGNSSRCIISYLILSIINRMHHRSIRKRLCMPRSLLQPANTTLLFPDSWEGPFFLTHTWSTFSSISFSSSSLSFSCILIFLSLSRRIVPATTQNPIGMKKPKTKKAVLIAEGDSKMCDKQRYMLHLRSSSTYRLPKNSKHLRLPHHHSLLGSSRFQAYRSTRGTTKGG